MFVIKIWISNNLYDIYVYVYIIVKIEVFVKDKILIKYKF